jgi:hypothetical protein
MGDTINSKILANMPIEVSVSTYTCDSCNCLKKGKPWISVDFPNKIYNSCSYSCNRKMDDVLPKGYYPLIINKEDFNGPMPVIRTKPTYKPFNFLTETEINCLNKDEYTKYTDNLNEELLLNPLRSKIYYEQLENEAYERAIEEEEDDGGISEDAHVDDY